MREGSSYLSARKQAQAWRQTAERYQSEPSTGEVRNELSARAKKPEQIRERAMGAYHQYELASAAAQIAIVLASASIITAMPLLAWIAGAALCVVGFFFPAALHLL